MLLHARTVYWVQRLESSEEVVWWCHFDSCSSPQVLYRLERNKTIEKLFFAVQEKCLFSVVSVEGQEIVDYYNFQTNRVVNLNKERQSVESVAAFGEDVFVLVSNDNHTQYVNHVPQHGQRVDSEELITNTFRDITILSPIRQRGTCVVIPPPHHRHHQCLTSLCVCISV